MYNLIKYVNNKTPCNYIEMYEKRVKYNWYHFERFKNRGQWLSRFYNNTYLHTEKQFSGRYSQCSDFIARNNTRKRVLILKNKNVLGNCDNVFAVLGAKIHINLKNHIRHTTKK